MLGLASFITPAMLSGADVRQALQAGLWEALADGSDRAAMRATCRDTRDIADALHDTAVLPVGPGTWDSGGVIAAYHRRLGAVRSVHVVYSGGAEDEARAAHFMEAYSAALGAALPAADCSIAMHSGSQLPTALAVALPQRVVPRVERLDMALGSYVNVAQLLQALEPCARLCSLRLLAVRTVEGPGLDGLCFEEHPGALDALCRLPRLCSLRLLPVLAEGGAKPEGPSPDDQNVAIRLCFCPGVLDALCRLPRLHTLSGPWAIEVPDLQRLCDALPSLTTLGFSQLDLDEAGGACISRRLHTLAAWCHSAGHSNVCSQAAAAHQPASACPVSVLQLGPIFMRVLWVQHLHTSACLHGRSVPSFVQCPSLLPCS